MHQFHPKIVKWNKKEISEKPDIISRIETGFE